jgi:hypothetical protein
MYRTVVTICTAQRSLYVPQSGHYMYRQFLTFTNSPFCPHGVFVWISEQTAIISLYRINGRVCITETESVYCAVRTGSSLILQVKKDKTQIPLVYFDSCVTPSFFTHNDRGQAIQCHFPSRVSNPNSTYVRESILIPSAKRACSSFRCMLQNIVTYTDQQTSASNLCSHTC